jgi:hypothetical protein
MNNGFCFADRMCHRRVHLMRSETGTTGHSCVTNQIYMLIVLSGETILIPLLYIIVWPAYACFARAGPPAELPAAATCTICC